MRLRRGYGGGGGIISPRGGLTVARLDGLAMACAQARFDANETVFFARQLEFIKTTIFRRLYAERSAFRMFPLSTDGGPGAGSITYRSTDRVGQAKIIAHYGRDLPRVDVTGRETTQPVRSIGASYGWSIQDVRAAAFAGRNLTGEKADAAVEAHNDETNRIAWAGDAEFGLPGLKTTTGIPTDTLPADGTAGSTKLSAKSADNVIRDVNSPITEMLRVTRGIHAPNVVAFPAYVMADLNSRPRANVSDTSILSYLRQSWPQISFETSEDLTDFGGAGIDAMMVYRRDPQVLQLGVPSPYEELPVQVHGLEFEIPTHSRVAGLFVYRPQAIRIRLGV